MAGNIKNDKVDRDLAYYAANVSAKRSNDPNDCRHGHKLEARIKRFPWKS